MKDWIKQSPGNMLIAVIGAIWLIATLLCIFHFGIGAGIWISVLGTIAISTILALVLIFGHILWECFHKDQKEVNVWRTETRIDCEK